MPLHTWLTFVAVTFCVCGTPGPNMLLMLSSGMRHGLRNTFFTMAGCALAVFSVTAASALGIGALIVSRPRFFDALRFLGAAYLIYLGVKTALAPVASPLDSDLAETIAGRATPGRHFKTGFTVGVSNPKLLLFATAFFPQFIDKALPELPQIGILLATFCLLDFGWYVVYATGGSRLVGCLRGQKARKAMNRTVGGLFTAFGLLLLKSGI